MKRNLLSIFILSLLATTAMAADKLLTVSSPDGKVTAKVNVGKELTYTIDFNGKEVLASSKVAMEISDGTVWGENCKLKKAKTKTINTVIPTPFTRQAEMQDNCNQLLLQFKGYNVEFRSYNNGFAYRFINTRKGAFQVKKEIVEYNFNGNQDVTTPYVSRYTEGKSTIQNQFFNSFENTYTEGKISELNKKRLSFLPLVVDLGEGKKMCIAETHLENYPGLYLITNDTPNQLAGVNAPYPKKYHQGGHNQLQLLVDEVEDYIAKVEAPRTFPWRIAMLSNQDIDLAENNLSYILAAPSRVQDISWIKPGKVAWDWWNDWNIHKVDFRAGVNNDTYKYYIDFASKNKIEYVILDEGWAVNKKADLLQVVPEIDLEMLVKYANERNVDLILWAGYYAFDRDMENVVKHFSEMGIKGFKIDFMDRDDQIVADFYYRAAETCARYKMLVDFHGAFKPAGLNITYPNVLNFEGVHGLEQMKWSDSNTNQVKYDCQLPFIRQAAGPMDYTQGAMKNAAWGKYKPNYSEPMSQGTRCRQLALYIILESPLNMLCDNPTAYMAEPECTSTIASIPTVWDETKVLCGEMGKYIVTARRSGSTWYIGGITDWTAREIEFTLPDGINLSRKGDLFKDGINADRKGEDYKREQVSLQKTMKIKLQRGGGFLMKI